MDEKKNDLLIKKFVSQYLRRMRYIKDNKIDTLKKEYRNGDVTFMFNCSVYDIVKHSRNVSMIVEPEANPTGRGGYSDILLKHSGKKRYSILIEHENDPLSKNALKTDSALNKLFTSARHNYILLYITYFKNLNEREKITNKLKVYKKQNRPIYLLMTDYDNITTKEKVIKIKNGREVLF